MSRNKELSNFAINVCKERTRQRLSQRQVADRAEINQATLSNIEAGSSDTTLGIASRIADALGVRLGDLLFKEVESSEEPRMADKKKGR